MTSRTALSRIALAAAFSAAAAAPAHVAAQQQLSDQWRFGAAIYGYFPDVGATAVFPKGGGATIDADAGQLIDHLRFAFFGSFEARKGRWGAFTDLMYFDIGGSRTG